VCCELARLGAECHYSPSINLPVHFAVAGEGGHEPPAPIRGLPDQKEPAWAGFYVVGSNTRRQGRPLQRIRRSSQETALKHDIVDIYDAIHTLFIADINGRRF